MDGPHEQIGTRADLFVRYGGHRAAAGLTMDAAQLPAFVERFDEVAGLIEARFPELAGGG